MATFSNSASRVTAPRKVSIRPKLSRAAPGGLSAPPSSGSDPVRVLLVDDEESICAAFRRLLQARGFAVDVAGNGGEALRMFQDGSYSAILSDINMPGLDGLGLLRAVRARNADVPFILMTGRPSVDTAARAVEYGALQYLMKPIELDDLVQALSRATRLYRMAMAERRAADLFGNDSLRPSQRNALEETLDAALRTLWMAFQPIVRASDGSVYAYEALLRTVEAELPTPAAVLEAAEKLNRLDRVGRVTRERAVGPMRLAGCEHMLFVNIHPRDLFDPDLLDPGAPLSLMAERVVLEITERSSLESGEHVRERIAALRALGFRIAVDDLGAGYAGLSSFAVLEPDIVKLDLSLVRDVHLSQTKQKLVRSMTRLAREMGILVVAEGVEVVEEKDVLVELGCDLLQGYLFAKPGKPFPAVTW